MSPRRIALVSSSLALCAALVSAVPATPLPGATSQTPPSTVSTQDDPAPKPGAGKPVLTVNDHGKKVRILQVRLQRVGVRDIPTSGLYGQETVAQVKAFQRLAGFKRTGVVDEATLAELVRRTGAVDQLDLAAGANQPYGARLPASCTHGRVICVDMRARSVRWVVDGVTKLRLDARFGAEGTPTREGLFRITRKSRDHVSTLYGSKMPFAMFFDRGQAVHYSSDFAARGYAGASHGCVNIRDRDGVEWLFDHAEVGDRVLVYHSKSAQAIKPAKTGQARSAT
jgi:peptidoglycan hydrolase-like protein with peptidoglycan-binding domain